MSFEQALYMCLSTFEKWYFLSLQGIGEPDLGHDGIEHAIVLMNHNLFVVPGDSSATDVAELLTLRVNEALFEGKLTYEWDGKTFPIPEKALALYKTNFSDEELDKTVWNRLFRLM